MVAAHRAASWKTRVLAVEMLLLTSLHLPRAEASESDCLRKNSIRFSTSLPRPITDVPESPKSSGLRKLAVGAQQTFAAFLIPTPGIPEALKDEKIKLNATLLLNLVNESSGLRALLAISCALAVLVPVVALTVALGRRAAGWRCGGGAAFAGQQLSSTSCGPTAYTKCGLALLTTLMTAMVVSSIASMGHLSVARENLGKQVKFLADNLGGVLEGPIEEMGLLVGGKHQEIVGPVHQRLDDCTKEIMSVVEHIAANGSLKAFVRTTAEHFRTIGQLLGDAESLVNGAGQDDLRRRAVLALDALREAEFLCGEMCDVNDLRRVRTAIESLEVFVSASGFVYPEKFRKLREYLTRTDFQEQIRTVWTSAETKAYINDKVRELKDMVANLNVGAFSEAFAKINASVSNAQAGLGGIVDRLAAHARDHMVVYWLVVYLAIAGMCLVVALYAVGGVCGVWRMDRFYAGSWLLSSAVYLFVVSFPVVLLASTAGVVVSTAIERFFCVPAQSTDAVTFGPFFQFITLQLADQTFSGKRTGGALIEHQHMFLDSSSNESRTRLELSLFGAHGSRLGFFPGGYFILARTEEGSTSRPNKTSWNEDSGSPTGGSFPPAGRHTARMLQSLEHGDQSNKNITSDYILAIMRKWFTRDAIAGVARRFAECSRDHMSFFKLLGQDEMVGIARDVMGNNSPWLSLLTEGYDLPDLRPLDQLNFEQEALKVVQAFKGKLGPVGDLLLKPDAILGLARAASEAEVSLENITSIKGNLHDVAARPVSEASAKINEAASLLDGISGDNIKAFVEAMAGVTGAAQALVLVSTVNEGGASKNIDEYVKEHVNNWGDLQTQLKDSVKEFSDKVADIKQAVMDDVNQYFRHAKTQIRDRIGDCHSLYLLYATSVNALCDGAVRPTGGFWFSVWFFFIIGIAGCIAAFALSMQYAISGTQGAVEPALPRETVEKPADVASEPTGPADNLTAAVDTKKEPADFAGQSTKTAALPTIAVDTEDSVHT